MKLQKKALYLGLFSLILFIFLSALSIYDVMNLYFSLRNVLGKVLTRKAVFYYYLVISLLIFYFWFYKYCFPNIFNKFHKNILRKQRLCKNNLKAYVVALVALVYPYLLFVQLLNWKNSVIYSFLFHDQNFSILEDFFGFVKLYKWVYIDILWYLVAVGLIVSVSYFGFTLFTLFIFEFVSYERIKITQKINHYRFLKQIEDQEANLNTEKMYEQISFFKDWGVYVTLNINEHITTQLRA
ncbi:hypothetical protein [Spiroplasma clarkii]|uniref:Uncharacterized protein n=1 Tax=Spiroplasma clarkii TaxID=2139 RepID=A0A2K8KIH0_9MOLU|nr:hypothetical protein [Spiroplasma clarkii]ATX71478.1 hypothetical protein SCLAR_v1c11780 [Spiroplasma clarkii]